MKTRKIEEKIIKSINTNDVPSLETIKSKMDFSKKPFKEKESKIKCFNKKLVLGCGISSLCTLVLCMVCMVIIAKNKLIYSNYIHDVLSKEEIKYINENYDEYIPIPVINVNIKEQYCFYVYECYSKQNDLRVYYYKVKSDCTNFEINLYFENNQKIINETNNFGELTSKDYNLKNQKIEFEIEIDGVKKYYCFTN